MILMICPFGLANRLFYFTRCISLAEATGHRVVCFNIPEAAQFESGQNGTLCLWPPPSSPGIALPNGLRRCCTLLLRKFVDLCRRLSLPWPVIFWPELETADQFSAQDPHFLQAIRSHRLVIMAGWIPIEKMTVPNPPAIRTFFTPKEELRRQTQNTAIQAKGAADILVGVHFRWGDFRRYGNGCFYFTPEVYLRVMKRCVELFPGQRVAFLAVSDEPTLLAKALDSFAPLPVTIGPGSALGDLYSLAECDYIICPASTFSLWAAFYGKKPCWCLKSPNALPDLSDFVVPENSFEGLHPEVSYEPVTEAVAPTPESQDLAAG